MEQNKPKGKPIPKLERERIRDIVEKLRQNTMLRRYLDSGNKVCDFPIDVGALEDVLSFTLEILYKHLPAAITRINAFEGVYNTWYSKFQLYDKLAKEVLKATTYPEEVHQLLINLGYKEKKNEQ